MSTHVSNKIRDLRLYLGLSQKNFGEAIGYSGNHIHRIEQNAGNPSEQLLRKVCDVFHVNPDYFTAEMPVDQAAQKVEVDTAEAGQRLRIARQEKGLSMWELSRNLTGADQHA